MPPSFILSTGTLAIALRPRKNEIKTGAYKIKHIVIINILSKQVYKVGILLTFKV